MIETAFICMALIWVINSWAKLLVKEDSKYYKYMCLKCWTFWITLALTLNPFTASVAALIAAVVDLYMSNTNITL